MTDSHEAEKAKLRRQTEVSSALFEVDGIQMTASDSVPPRELQRSIENKHDGHGLGKLSMSTRFIG